MAKTMIPKSEALAAVQDDRHESRERAWKSHCSEVLKALRRVKASIAALGLLAVLAALLLVGCASGRSGTQVVQACSGLPALQAYCQTSLVKSRQLTRTCEQVPLAQLLCAVTAAPRAESAAASVMPSCPEPPAPACVGALLESQGWRTLTSSRREKLRACADYLVSVQACRDRR